VGLLISDGGFGCIGNIIDGIIARFLVGCLGGKLGVTGAVVGSFSVASPVTAVLGTVILLFIAS